MHRTSPAARRTATLALALLLLPAAAVACGDADEDAEVDTDEQDGEEGGEEGGSGEPSGSAAAALGAALQDTEAASTATFTMRIESEVIGQEILVTVEGATDLASGDVTSEATTSAGGVEAVISQVMQGGTLYQTVPEGVSYPGVDTPWVAIDVSEMGAGLGTAGASASPDQLFALIEDVDGEVVDEGAEDIDGTATTHYSADLGEESVAALFESMGPMFEQMLQGSGLPSDADEAFADAFAAADVEYEIDVWVGDDGRIRRTETTMDLDFVAVMADIFEQLDLPESMLDELDSLGGRGRMSTVSTMDFTSFGEPVDIQVPDESEVTPIDFGELMSGS
jgi:hypothetical protein